MQILGLLSSVYISYLILLAPGIKPRGSTPSSEQQSRIMSQVILLALIWEIELQNSIPQKGTGQDQILMEGMYRINETTQILEIFLLIQVQIILQLYAKEEIKSEQYLILMTNQIGQQNQLESHDLIITITAWEQVNQSLYLLVTMGLYMKTQSQSAGLKYFQLSAQTTGFLQMGISQIYSSTGTTNLDILWAIQSQMETSIPSEQKIGLLLQSVPQVQKQAAAPFHNWAPDLYDAIPTPIVLWIALIPKQGICIQLQNLAPLLLIFSEFYYVVGIISVIIGSIALGSQWKIKRFLAYSAISHIGFLQLAYLSLAPSDFVGGAYINYLIIYMLTSQQIFIILQSINTSLDQQTSPSLKEFSGIFKKNPAQGIALAISQFSQAGIPPQAGFFAKLLVQESILAESKVYIALILILTSAISTANYLSVIKMSLFDLPSLTTPIIVTPIQAYQISGLYSQIQFYYLKPALYLSLLF